MPQVYTDDHATPRLTEGSSSVLGELISSTPAPESIDSTSDDTSGRTVNYDQNTAFAYEANPTSDTTFCTPAYAAESASDIQDAYTRTGYSHPLTGTTNADVIPNLHFTSFGTQPWPVSIPSSYIDPLHCATYESTGHSIEQTATTFDKFDDSAKYRPARDIAAATSSKPLEHFEPFVGPVTSLSAASNNGQLQPKSALKRHLRQDSQGNISKAIDQSTLQQRPLKIRRVSFEQMSATGPGSADDEDSSASEAPVTGKSSLRGSYASGLRRGRGSRAAGIPSQTSTGRPATSSVPQQVAISRGSKTPTGHPPSILPPEKVFPVQIGSELFRLSGASISSDAPSYFTQFFEEQIRRNEESGGIRPLYIDRDPETFRDIVRHLQGR